MYILIPADISTPTRSPVEQNTETKISFKRTAGGLYDEAILEAFGFRDRWAR